MLYDSPADVVRKALRGHDLAPSQLAQRAGVGPHALADFLAGQFDPDLARALATPLGLDPHALAMLPEYAPPARMPTGITRLDLPFDDEQVNAWLLEREGVHLVIDAGAGRDDLARALAQRAVGDFHLLITHGHHDHLAGIPGVRSRILSLHSPEAIAGSELVAAGDSLEIGPFRIEVVDLAGHHPRAVGYFIDDPGLLAVGDAVFAGSMGGCPDAITFQRARKSIERSLAGLPGFPDIHLLTGHGPGTTIAGELVANPFLAAWKFED